MILHRLTEAPIPPLGQALAEFERLFSYPLGRDHFFRISHGGKYLPFFQAMGEAAVQVAESGGVVSGTLAQVRRTAEFYPASGAMEPTVMHYLCDLKVRPSARGSRVLARLMQAVRTRIEADASQACYAVVMEGTGRLPTGYTGRLGVPAFRKLGEIGILRLSADRMQPWADKGIRRVTPSVFYALRRRLETAGYSLTGGDSTLRSRMPPVFLADAGEQACGCLEDTRLGKKLFAGTGQEMLSGHLSGFRFKTPSAGARLLLAALQTSAKAGLPALFAALPWSKVHAVMACLPGVTVNLAPAGIFGHGLREDQDWCVDTAEI